MSRTAVDYEFLEDRVVFHVREHKPNGVPDSYYDVTVPYSETYEISPLPDKNLGDMFFSVWCPHRWETIAFIKHGYWENYGWDGWEDDVSGPFTIPSPEYGPRPSHRLVSQAEVSTVRINLTDVYREIREQIVKKKLQMHELSDGKFEEFVASILHNQGYSIEFTKRDSSENMIIALSSNPFSADLRLIVECRKNNPADPISLMVVHELWEIVKDSTSRFDRGIIATSSFLSEDAQKSISTRGYWKISKLDHDDIMSFAGFTKDRMGIWLPSTYVPRTQAIEKAKCFISYSRTNESIALKLKKSFEDQGILVWRDQDNIPAGTNWDVAIENAIRECTHFLVLITPASTTSQTVQDEINLALSLKKTVVPILLEACTLPFRLQRIQWIDFTGDYEAAFARLVSELNTV